MKDVLQDLKSENNFAFGQLYQDNFHKISVFVKKNNGTENDAEDIFQDAMIVLVDKLRTDDFQLTASINTYVYAICKNLWYKKLREDNYQISLDKLHEDGFQASIDSSIESEKTYLEKLTGYLNKITAHCNRMIHDIFFKQKSIEEIQKKYGYSSKHNAQNQKYKCLQQIKKIKEQEQAT